MIELTIFLLFICIYLIYEYLIKLIKQSFDKLDIYFENMKQSQKDIMNQLKKLKNKPIDTNNINENFKEIYKNEKESKTSD